MKKIIIAVFATFYYLISWAQVSDPSFISSSPSAAELGKHGQIPVGLFTGTESYSVPIYELKSKNLTIPISLDYSSSGFQVDKVASWVGFDWSLSAGGVITRIAKGLPDDINGIDRTSFPIDILTYINNSAYSLSDYSTIATHFFNYCQDYETRDYEPDLYSYNFAGNAGMFYIDNNQNFVTIPYHNFNISYSAITKTFVITTEDGIKYTFEAKESSRNPNTEGYYAGKSSYVSYCLTQITHPAGDNILLYYKSPTQYTYCTGISHTRTYCPQNLSVPCQYDPGINYYPEAIYSEVNEVVLDSIVSPGFGKLVFNKSINLVGVYGYRLNSIDFLNAKRILTSSTSFCYQFPSTTNYNTGLSNVQGDVETSTTRMFLDSIVTKDPNGLRGQKYAFEYEDISGLPVRLSYSKDHWGYFNGASNSSSLPSTSVPSGMLQYFTDISWANRDPNANYSKKGMLKKIIYPTGGYTLIDYEANKQFETTEIGGVRVAQTTTYPKAGDTPIIKKYLYSGGQAGSDAYTSYYSESKIYTEAPAPYSGSTPYQLYKVSNQTNFNLGRYGGGHIGYANVKIKNGINGENGTEEHQFTIAFDMPSIVVDNTSYGCKRLLGENNLNPPPFSNTGWNNGEKLKEIYYNNSMTKVREITYNYTSDASHEIINYYASVKKTGLVPYGNCGGFYCGDGILVSTDPGDNFTRINKDFDAWSYSLISKWRYLSSKTEINYDGNGQNPITTTTNYYYDNSAHAQLTREETNDSKGNLIKKVIKYPEDYTTTSYNIGTLKTKHIVNTPLDIRNYVGSTLAEGQQIKYNIFGQPTDFYKAETSGTDITFSPTNPYTFTHKSTFQYDDANHTVIQTTKDNDYSTSYIWGYNQTLPVAKIVNATYSTVSSNSTLMNYINQLQNYTVLTTSTDRNALKTLNNNIRSNAPANSMITTYTYAPLVGMTSQSDPNGVTTYYEYDTFGRLKLVRNDDTHITNRYNYHYKQ